MPRGTAENATPCRMVFGTVGKSVRVPRHGGTGVRLIHWAVSTGRFTCSGLPPEIDGRDGAACLDLRPRAERRTRCIVPRRVFKNFHVRVIGVRPCFRSLRLIMTKKRFALSRRLLTGSFLYPSSTVVVRVLRVQTVGLDH